MISTAEKKRGRVAVKITVLLVLVGGFTAGAAWYGGWSARNLPAMAEGLGEVWMERAARSEDAGALEDARAYYERALASDFHGPQNRSHCEKRLGIVLYRLGNYEAALPCLQRAQASPYRSLNGYRPLVDTLVALERWEEVRAAIAIWKSEDQDGGETWLPALARLHAHDGDLNQARKAMSRYLRNAYPGDDTARDWAALEQWQR